MVVMARLKRQRRVSWARDDDLCKVRLFLSEDAPSQSGFGAQDHLQAKAAWLLHTSGVVDSDDSLPPGFEKLHKLQPKKIEISQIPIINWQCPPRLAVNPEWLVVAGEESGELARENQRHLGVLEAVYPRPSSIPPNPAVALEAQDATVIDSQTPLIPITGIEEEEDSTEESDAVSPSNCCAPLRVGPQDLRSSLRQPPPRPIEGSRIPNLPRVETRPPSMAATMVTAVAGTAPGAGPDFVAAASAAFTAIMKSSEEGSLVDRDLLIKILSDPGMMERLASEYGGGPKQSAQPKQNPQASATPPVAATSAGAAPRHASLPLASQYMAATSVAIPPPPPACHTRTGAVSPLSAPVPHSFQLPNMATPSSRPRGRVPTVPPVNGPVVKDANYYKSLIQLHGGERQEAFALDRKPLQARFGSAGSLKRECYQYNMVEDFGQKQTDTMKSKVLKPCAYFNTPRGCRHGAGCLFRHDGCVHRAFEQQKGATKRIKLDGGIGGSS